MAGNTTKGQWKKVRGKIQEEWGEITDDELDQLEGHREQLVGRIQQRYGQKRDDIEKKIGEMFDRAAG